MITESVVWINIHPTTSIILFYSLSVSASEDSLTITPGGALESGASLQLTTQDTDRGLPAVTTAPPVNVPNHHPLYRNPLQHQVLLGPHSQPKHFEDSGGASKHPSSQPTSSASPHGTPLDNSDKRASEETAESSNMQTTFVMHALAATSHSNTPLPLTSVVIKDPEHAAVSPYTAAAAGEKNEERPDQPGLKHNASPGNNEKETTTTTITTTTIITTMQSPGKNTAL